MLDGKVVFKGDIGGAEDLQLANVKGTDGWAQILERFQKIPVKVEAGKHDDYCSASWTVRMWNRTTTSWPAAEASAAAAVGAPMARLADPKNVSLEIKGPYNPTGISHSTTRPLIFVCDPAKIGETAVREADRGEPGASRLPPARDRRTTSPT